MTTPDTAPDQSTAPPPVMTSDQIMQHVDSVYSGLPDPVKAALDHAHTLTGGAPSTGLAGVAKPSPAAPAPLSTASAPATAPTPMVPGMVGVHSDEVAPSPVDAAPNDDLPLSPSPIRIPSTDMAPAPNAAPPVSPHATELQRLHQTGSGISQIHNPLLRGLATAGDVVASGLFPQFGRFIPGTTAHNMDLQREERQQLGEEQAGAKSAADVARDKGLTDEAEANANAKNNPQQKQEEAGKTITTDQGIMQWNPSTQRYDIKAGGTPEKAEKETGTVHQTEDGTFIIAKPDGTAIPLTIDGKPVKGPAKEKATVSPEQQFIDEFRAKNNGASIADAEKAFKQLVPKEPVDRGQNFIDPSTHQLVRVEPGGKVPEGAMTAAGVNAVNTPTMTQRTAAGRAQTVHEMLPEVVQNIDAMKDRIGALSGRWNKFMQGEIGNDDPDMAGLRANLLMTSSAMALAHAQGRLPENLREEFDKAINDPKQTASNLKATLSKMDPWLVKMMEQGGKATPATAGNPKIGDTKKFPNGKTGKFDGTGWVAQ